MTKCESPLDSLEQVCCFIIENVTVLLTILSFTVLRCQRLFPPPNGFLVGHCDNTYGTTCRIQCKDGYDLIGADNITCEVERGHISGYWNWDQRLQRASAVCQGRQMTVKKYI